MSEAARVLERDAEGMPTRILILPRGGMVGNGRRYVLDAQSELLIQQMMVDRGEAFRLPVDWEHESLEPGAPPEKSSSIGWWYPVLDELGLVAVVTSWEAAAYDWLPNTRKNPARTVRYWSPVLYLEALEDGTFALRALGPLALTNNPGTLRIEPLTAGRSEKLSSNVGHLARRRSRMKIEVVVPDELAAGLPEGTVAMGFHPSLGVLADVDGQPKAWRDGAWVPVAVVKPEMEAEAMTAKARVHELGLLRQTVTTQAAQVTALAADLERFKRAELERATDERLAGWLASGRLASQEVAASTRQALLTLEPAARDALVAAVDAIPARVTPPPVKPAAKPEVAAVKTRAAFDALPMNDRVALMAEMGPRWVDLLPRG